MAQAFRKLAFLLACLFIVQFASAQAMPDLLKAFRKLEAALDSGGMKKSEFRLSLADINAQMRSYQDASPNRQPESFKVLRQAYSQYKKAQDLFDEEEELTRKYENHKMSINAYFDRKEQMIGERDALWKAASVEIDRAAKLIGSKK